MRWQVDHIIVGLGPSTDGTTEIVEGLASELPLTLREDNARNFQQREVMTAYAHEAREMGAQWVVPFDVDEVWFSDAERIGDRLMGLPEYVLIAEADLLTHRVTGEDDPDDSDAFSRMQWRGITVAPLPKIAARARSDLAISHGNHGALFDGLAPTVRVLVAHHFPYRSVEQLVKRIEGCWPQLKASGLPRSHGQHMWELGELLDAEGPEGISERFERHFATANPADDPELVHDPLPSLVVEEPA
jgi:hypothetical protein